MKDWIKEVEEVFVKLSTGDLNTFTLEGAIKQKVKFMQQERGELKEDFAELILASAKQGEEFQALKNTLKDYFYKMEKGYDYNNHQKRQENIKSLIK